MSADQLPYQVADLSLAAFGRKEIQLAEHEMPGLMAVREEYAPSQPLRRRRSLSCPKRWSRCCTR